MLVLIVSIFKIINPKRRDIVPYIKYAVISTDRNILLKSIKYVVNIKHDKNATINVFENDFFNFHSPFYRYLKYISTYLYFFY